MHNNIPQISIVVPAHNEEEYISKSLKSLSAQSLDRKKYEIVVVDNASTDNTAKISSMYADVVVYEPRRSVVSARQKGAGVAKGKIIVSADADTIYPKKYLAKINSVFENNPDCIAIVGWIYFDKTTFFFNFLTALSQEVNALLKRLTGKFPLVFAANFAFKKEYLDKIGGYPTHLPELGDQQYLLYKFFKLGKVLIRKDIYCKTSARRQRQGTNKSIIQNSWYRILGYTINGISKKEIMGPAPAIREKK